MKWSDITKEMCEQWTSRQILFELKDSCWHSQVSLAHIVDGIQTSRAFELEDYLKSHPEQMWYIYEVGRCSGAGISYTTIAVMDFDNILE